MNDEIVINGITYVKKEKVKNKIKLHDIVKYKGYEWYVIKNEENEVTLMTKDVIGSVTYSGNNSNDWEESNVREYLDSWLVNTNIDLTDLIGMTTNYDENKFFHGKIRIPTLREIESLPMNIRNRGKSYWTMTSSYGVSKDCSHAHVFSVNMNGNLNITSVFSTIGVRPVITVKTDVLSI